MSTLPILLGLLILAPMLALAQILAILSTPALAAEAQIYIPIAALFALAYGWQFAKTAALFIRAPEGRDALARWGWGL